MFRGRRPEQPGTEQERRRLRRAGQDDCASRARASIRESARGCFGSRRYRPRMGLTVVMVADIPSGAEAAFQAYESAVLPLLLRHGGCLERRLRTGDALTEVHVVSFESQEGYESYLADEERQSHRTQLDCLDVVQRVLHVADVPVRVQADG